MDISNFINHLNEFKENVFGKKCGTWCIDLAKITYRTYLQCLLLVIPSSNRTEYAQTFLLIVAIIVPIFIIKLILKFSNDYN